MSNGFTIAGADFSYGSVAAIRDLTLTLPPGKFYGIVGPNGCGKTTLLDLLIGSRRPSSGTVSFHNRPVVEYRRRDLSRQVALVPQDFSIGFAFTVHEVVLMGRHPYLKRFSAPSSTDLDQVESAMDTIGISHFRDRFVNELSGGEKQRVVVARALAQDTPVILFDEATSNLDIRYTLEILNVAKRLVREEKKTVIAVIHNLNLAAAYCDEIVFMKQGRVVASGPADTVMAPETIKEVFGIEIQVRQDDFSKTNQVSYRYWS